uniref:Uncharacterized protein n=1 Tax=Nelumbo nucifera TaxID=4432 RepID=A0A822YPN2_NELNU|nr:TPA_asm: hypothetical protein HUJ06_011826 [Nelumbo nucifera]
MQIVPSVDRMKTLSIFLCIVRCETSLGKYRDK